MGRLGVFGGTFDPPHIGHLILAEEALAQLQVDRLLWLLAADPPHKQERQLTPLDDRLAMLQAAIMGNSRYELSRVDLDRPGPHYTADALRLILAEHPAKELIFLMGGDSLNDLPTWHQPEEILAQARLGVMRRPGQSFDLEAMEAVLPGISGRVTFLDVPMIEISSHDIRRRVGEGLPYRYMVPEGVQEIIEGRGLYRKG